jgi:hypothetical protein
MLEVTCKDQSGAAQTVGDMLTMVPARIIYLVSLKGQARERYAALRIRALTQAAHDLIAHIRDDVEEQEQREGVIRRAILTP